MLAFYYNWFDENSWGRQPGARCAAAALRVADRGVMGRQIDQAKAAGIDAFVVSWYGPRVENNQTETNLRALLDEAAARGFRVAVDLKWPGRFSAGRATYRARWRRCLRRTRNIRPISVRKASPSSSSGGQQRFNIGTWAAIRNAVDPGRGSVWIEEGVDVSPLSVFDGHHLYSVTWNPPTGHGPHRAEVRDANPRRRRQSSARRKCTWRR